MGPNERVYSVKDLAEFSKEKATVKQLALTENSVVFVWGVLPGQEVGPHIHPRGQDTWVMIQGELTYYLGNGETETIRAGDLDIAPKNAVHGAVNQGTENAIFLSIYSSPDIGYEPAEK